MRSVLVTGAAISLLFLCGLATGCFRRDAARSSADKTATGSTVPGWIRHQDAAGFVVEHPKGWGVEVGADARILIHSPERSTFALVQPYLVTESPVPADAAAFLRRAMGQFGTLFPEARPGSITPRRATEALGELAFSAAGREASASILCTLDGRAGMLYAIAAPTATFTADRATLTRILQTFAFVENGAAAIHDPYYRWREPKERMFELDVPDGWAVEGGLYRISSTDARTEVRATSPDGKVRVFIGDATVRPYCLPTDDLTAAGFREGMEYDPGLGTKYIVRSYQSGVQYAKDYVSRRQAQGIQGMAFREVRDRPVTAAEIQAIYSDSGTNFQQVSVGDLAFSGAGATGPVHGFCLAGTMLTGLPGVEGGAWTVNLLYGYTADPEREAEAQSVLRRMTASFKLNPEWVSAQQGLAAPLSDIVSRSGIAVGKSLDAAFRGAAGGGGTDRFSSNMTLGMADWRDPATGTLYQAAVGKNYYWHRAGTAPRESVNLSGLGAF